MATQNLSLITQQTEEEKKKKQLVDPTQASVAPKQLKSPTGLGVNPFAASTAVQQNKNNLAGVDTSIKRKLFLLELQLHKHLLRNNQIFVLQ